MTPALPAFAGYVPAAFTQLYPGKMAVIFHWLHQLDDISNMQQWGDFLKLLYRGVNLPLRIQIP